MTYESGLSNWSELTTEGYSAFHNEILLGFNFSFSDEVFNRSIQFIVGKICYGTLHFPENAGIYVKIDIRGQRLSSDIEEKIRQAIYAHIEELNAANKIRIDFLK